MRTSVLTALAAVLALAAGSVSAEVIHYFVKLDGASETPPKATNGTGKAEVSLDTDRKMLTWKIEYSGLTGPATMAHFHGPAAIGAAAGVQVNIAPPLASPISGMTTLTDGQIGDLLGGLWYINVHTAANPAGEIRGQVLTH
jgi:hypothetical protein